MLKTQIIAVVNAATNVFVNFEKKAEAFTETAIFCVEVF